MKALLAFTFIFSTSVAFAGKLNIDVVPSHGGATYLEFTEANGTISSIGNGPFSGTNNTTSIQENRDGSLQGFVFGTAFNLVCSDTGCVNNGATEVSIAITKSGATTNYDGTVQYHFVHASVTGSEIRVTSDGSFDSFKRKNDTFDGQGAFSRVRYGAFDVRLTPSGGFNLSDPRLFVLTVLNIFTGR
jgi:hypothetical protein